MDQPLDKPIDIRAMAHQADVFERSAKLLLSEAGQPLLSSSLGTAAMVNAAFSVEVGIKAVIALEQQIQTYQSLRTWIRKRVGFRNEHSLDLLFACLSEDMQFRIRLYFEIHEPPHWDGILVGESPFDFARGVMALAELDTFPKMIAHASRAFETWRYRYELPPGAGSITFLIVLAESVIESLPRPFHDDGPPWEQRSPAS